MVRFRTYDNGLSDLWARIMALNTASGAPPRNARSWQLVLALCLALPLAQGQAQPLSPARPINEAPAPLLVRDGINLELAFNDEFDFLALSTADTIGWTPHFAHGPQGQLDERTLRNNRELQVYVDPSMLWRRGRTAPQTLRVENGVLILSAHRLDPRDRSAAWDYEYASGMVSAHRLYRQTYGYFEMRARLPSGRGLWPAFWLLPQSGRWPPEIDVLEALGHDTQTYYASYHANAAGVRSTRTSRIDRDADLSQGFHDYGVLWTADFLIYYFDAEEVARYPTPADMHEPMYMLLNLAVGGVWAGPPDDVTVFPARYEIDFVRAYRIVAPARAEN